jgi:peptide/nickel transport system permease protein
VSGLRNTLRRLPVTARIGMSFIALIAVVGIFAPLFVTHNPTASGLASPVQGPSAHLWFGADLLGRDVYSRLIAGTRRSLIVGFVSAGLSLVAGSVLGALAASGGRIADEVIMRLLDVIMAFPTIVLAAMLIIAFGKGSLLVLVLAIAFVSTPQMARIARAGVLAQYQEDYVAAEQVIGAGRAYILRRHVLRNFAAPVLVFATVQVANAIVFEASLSFIGAGLQGQDGPSSWGSVIAFGEGLLASHGWWATFFPGMLILLTVLALNMVSEGISDTFAAPAPARDARSAAFTPSIAARASEPAELPGLAEAARRLAASARPLPAGEPLLSVRDLHVSFHGGADDEDVSIVDGVAFDVRPGEILGLAGESGCGKSLTALAIAGLQPAGARVAGEIRFEGRDLLTVTRRQRRGLMGRHIAMVYQDALSALNPAMTIGAQVRQLTRRDGTRSPVELMALVGLDPGRTLKSYPHELSGGQRQRVVIAMALSRSPKLIIADEPTTALDVTVQAQIVELLVRLQTELEFAMIFVSHDLALIAELTDRLVIMYGGRVAECGATPLLLTEPLHHYTRGLLAAVLSLEAAQDRLSQIPGVVPSPADFPAGCRFADRCGAATVDCTATPPRLSGDTASHAFACHHPARTPSLRESRGSRYDSAGT